MPEGVMVGVAAEAMGSTPNVGEDLQATQRTVTSVAQAVQICEGLIKDWEKGIKHAARITAKLNGERPYNKAKLKAGGKDWKTNISTGFLQTECSKVLPRFYMPLKTAKYLTAASLPAGYPQGEEKTAHFRQTITDTIRRWPKWNFYTRGLAREVGIWGFGFNVWFDEYDWRPTLIRQDRGFVPAGTEVMDTEIPLFLVKYDYKPGELLSLLRASVEAGRQEWNVDATVNAINSATPPPADASSENLRSYEDLIRQSSYSMNYAKGIKMIQTWHLFAKEVDGAVSHYILLANGNGSSNNGDSSGKWRLLYEGLDRFPSMADAVNTVVFDYGDGTIHGSLGAGQILYDLAVQVEKVRCDSIDNMRMTNKLKLQVPDAKNANDVKLVVNDTAVIASGGTFAGNTAGISQDIEAYEVLDQKLSRIAQEKIGAFVPPIPTQPSDIKAAQINAALSKEREIQEALLENWLIQLAVVMGTMTRRLCNPESNDSVAQECQATLLEKLTPDEIQTLASQFPITSVMEFTEFAAQKRAMFASSVKGDPLFRQSYVARVMAEGVGDQVFVESITIPEGDQSEVNKAIIAQMTESAAFPVALSSGTGVPVLPSDNDWIHMQTLKPSIEVLLSQGNHALGQVALDHYTAHWGQGVAKKTLPKEEINGTKAWIAAAQKNIEALKSQAAIRQQAAQIKQTVESAAMEVVSRDGQEQQIQ